MNIKLLDGQKIAVQDTPFASGAKGACFLSSDKKQVVKLFTNIPDTTIDILRAIIGRYHPFRNLSSDDQQFYGAHLCWPTGIAVAPSLGVIMPRVTLPFRLTELLMPKWRKLKVPADKKGTIIGHLGITLRLARAVRLFHNNGLCHSDLSLNNAMVNPITGEMTMIDLDGLVIEGMIPPVVYGTPGFMAPEIVIGKTHPTIQTDRHALAVIFFKTLLFRHPLAGKRTFSGCDAFSEDRLMYGEQPLYTDHPTDSGNRPRGGYVPVSSLGPHLETLFSHTFVDGIADPECRPLASDWESGILKTLDRVIPCANQRCEAKAFVVTDKFSGKCPYCGDNSLRNTELPILRMYRSAGSIGMYNPETNDGGSYLLVCPNGFTLHEWHLKPGVITSTTDRSPYATVMYDARKREWYLKNHRIDNLYWVDDKGRQYCPVGKSIPLKPSNQLQLGVDRNSRLALVEFHRLS